MPQTDYELWTIASSLMQEHGQEAMLIAAQRLHETSEAGDKDGAVGWAGVLQRISRLTVGAGDGSA